MVQFLQYTSGEQRMKGLFNTFTKKYYGMYKVDCIGDFYDNDFGYIKVLFEGLELPARPVYGVGDRVMLPTKEWLQQFSKYITFLVAFEEGDMHKCFWMGWCFKDDAISEAIESANNSASFRSICFTEQFNDTAKEYRVTFKADAQDTDGQFYAFGVKGWISKFKDMLFESISGMILKAKDTLTLNASIVKLGSADAEQPSVKGDTLNKNLNSILDNTINGMTELSTQLAVLATAAAVNPATSGLGAGLTQAAKGVTEMVTKLSKDKVTLAEHLNDKVLL
jgi:hypothetical protein